MRTLFFILFAFIALSLPTQQSYNSSRIIAYSGGAYERAIKDLNYALEEVKKILKEEAANAYFYRGLSMLRLTEKEPESEVLSEWRFLKIFVDFDQATLLEAMKWKKRVRPEAAPWYNKLFQEGLMLFSLAEKSAYGSVNARKLYGLTADHLKASRSIRDNYEVSYNLGRVYHRLADNYASANIGRFTANLSASSR